MQPKWLEWAIKLQSIAQAGLTFAVNQYDTDRYLQIRNLSVEILSEYTGMNNEKIRDLFASDSGYQTPKVDIRASVFRDDKILMVREKIDGMWSLPGGWAEVNTSVSESVVRECMEEAGAIVVPSRIIAVQLANKHNNHLFPYTIYKIFVECVLVKNSFSPNTETFESDFFALESLPPLSTDRTTFDQVSLCFNAKKHKTFEAVFD